MPQGAAFGSPPANFAMVDGRLWRGAAPDPDGWRWLYDQGVRTALNLEWEASDGPHLGGSDILRIRIRDFEPLPFFAPSLADEHVVRALAAIRRGPSIVYVHCRSGLNRTGVVVAAYRILERDYSPETAIAEFKRYRGFWAMMDAHYIRSLDRRRADLLDRVKNLASL